MGKTCIYKMCFDGKEITGTAKELSEASGYCLQMIGMIARGETKPRDGVSVEELENVGSGNPSDWRRDTRILDAWDKAVARFKNVEWVGKDSNGCRKLEVM